MKNIFDSLDYRTHSNPDTKPSKLKRVLSYMQVVMIGAPAVSSPFAEIPKDINELERQILRPTQMEMLHQDDNAANDLFELQVIETFANPENKNGEKSIVLNTLESTILSPEENETLRALLPEANREANLVGLDMDLDVTFTNGEMTVNAGGPTFIEGSKAQQQYEIFLAAVAELFKPEEDASGVIEIKLVLSTIDGVPSVSFLVSTSGSLIDPVNGSYVDPKSEQWEAETGHAVETAVVDAQELFDALTAAGIENISIEKQGGVLVVIDSKTGEIVVVGAAAKTEKEDVFFNFFYYELINVGTEPIQISPTPTSEPVAEPMATLEPSEDGVITKTLVKAITFTDLDKIKGSHPELFTGIDTTSLTGDDETGAVTYNDGIQNFYLVTAQDRSNASANEVTGWMPEYNLSTVFTGWEIVIDNTIEFFEPLKTKPVETETAPGEVPANVLKLLEKAEELNGEELILDYAGEHLFIYRTPRFQEELPDYYNEYLANEARFQRRKEVTVAVIYEAFTGIQLDLPLALPIEEILSTELDKDATGFATIGDVLIKAETVDTVGQSGGTFMTLREVWNADVIVIQLGEPLLNIDTQSKTAKTLRLEGIIDPENPSPFVFLIHSWNDEITNPELNASGTPKGQSLHGNHLQYYWMGDYLPFMQLEEAIYVSTGVYTRPQ